MSFTTVFKLQQQLGLPVHPVARLTAGQKIEHALYHESATPLLNGGESVTPHHLRAFAQARIKELFECRSDDDVQRLAAFTRKQLVPLASVPLGTPVPHNIYNLQNHFLLRKGGLLTKSQYDNLLATNGENVYINEESVLKPLNEFGIELIKAQAESLEEKFTSAGEGALQVETGVPLLPLILKKQPARLRPPDELRAGEFKRDAHVQQVAELLGELWQHKTVDVQKVSRVADSIYDTLLSDVALNLHFTNCKDSTRDRLQQHSVNVTTLALTIGLQLGYPEPRLKELALAALLHEVGMFSVPDRIYTKAGELTWQERAEIQNHPMVAFEYLGTLGLPDVVILAIYQEHEAPNRTGYPNRRPGSALHEYAKILSVCDAYDAMTSPRPHRAAMAPYHAVEEMVRATAKQRYDGRIVKAFLQSVGLFPIGSWLKLSNNEIVRVIRNRPDPFDRPAVTVMRDENGKTPPTPTIVDLGARQDLRIVGVEDATKYADTPLLAGF